MFGLEDRSRILFRRTVALGLTIRQELKERLELYLQEVNENPVPFRWKYGLENGQGTNVISGAIY